MFSGMKLKDKIKLLPKNTREYQEAYLYISLSVRVLKDYNYEAGFYFSFFLQGYDKCFHH